MSEYILNKDYFIKVIEDLAVLAEEKKIIFRNWIPPLAMVITG